MKKFLIVVLALLFITGIFIVRASGQDYGYKGSFSGYDVSTDMIVLKMIESQTDPETEKVMIGGMALKFEYFSNALVEIDGYLVAAVNFSDKEDKYHFDYYVKEDMVVKIILFSKNGEFINKQVYPEKKGERSEEKKK
ncbi:hypothetical protein ACFL1N_07295 [Thermodesulfobacteriota bacterium]